jgi:hypothetical protein
MWIFDFKIFFRGLYPRTPVFKGRGRKGRGGEGENGRGRKNDRGRGEGKGDGKGEEGGRGGRYTKKRKGGEGTLAPRRDFLGTPLISGVGPYTRLDMCLRRNMRCCNILRISRQTRLIDTHKGTIWFCNRYPVGSAQQGTCGFCPRVLVGNYIGTTRLQPTYYQVHFGLRPFIFPSGPLKGLWIMADPTWYHYMTAYTEPWVLTFIRPEHNCSCRMGLEHYITKTAVCILENHYIFGYTSNVNQQKWNGQW